MSENKSLNRGLDALLGDQKLPTTTKEIDLNKITAGRYQPRQEFDDVKIQELADSIKKHGVLSPILVREVGLDRFEVIAGERRVRASKIAGLKTIPSMRSDTAVRVGAFPRQNAGWESNCFCVGN